MRYFFEVAYMGTRYSGFQVQQNANTIQSEIEKAFQIIQKEKIILTGSSRTDAGVHAAQNFFHFDMDKKMSSKFLYNINAILPDDIVIKKIISVHDEAHCRFDATGRSYQYSIYQTKNPFIKDRAYYFPYLLDFAKLQEAAELVKSYSDFTSFSKKNTQVKSFNCVISQSEWKQQNDCWVYHVTANRFLRGMVRALVATMLLAGRGKITSKQFRKIIEAKDGRQAKFNAPAHGLSLTNVEFSENYF